MRYAGLMKILSIKKLIIVFVSLCLATSSFGTVFAAAKRIKPSKQLQQKQSQEKSWAEVFASTKDKVVQIFSYGRAFDWTQPYKQGDLEGCSGTGFLVSAYGDIYTNFHVVNGAELIFIQMPQLGKERFAVQFIGGSPQFDCAHLKINAPDLERMKALLAVKELDYLHLGDSDNLQQGQEVMLLGYPMGEENVKGAHGIISGHEQTDWGECMSTTTPSNPGNSGGPYMDKNGDVIGICVGGWVYAQGINYLLPITRLKVILDELRDGKVVDMPFWGLHIASTTPATLQFLGNHADAGVYVSAVAKDSLASKAGIEQGDIIAQINGWPVDRFGYMTVPWTKYKVALSDGLARIKTGSEATFVIYRGGKKVTCSAIVTLDTPLKIRKYYPPFHQTPPYIVFGGMVIMELTQNHMEMIGELADQLIRRKKYIEAFRFFNEAHKYASKLFITHIFPESELGKNRVFQIPDRLISKVNGIEVSTICEFEQAVCAHAKSGHITVQTEQGSIVALPIADVLKQDPVFAEKYQYDLPELVMRLGQS